MEKQTVSRNWLDELQNRRDALINAILLAGWTIGTAATIWLYFAMEDNSLPAMLPFIIGVVAVFSSWLLRRLLSYHIRAWVLSSLVYIYGIYLLYNAGLPGGGRMWLLLFPTLTVVLLNVWPSGIIAGILSVLTYGLFSLLVGLGYVTPATQDVMGLHYWLGEGTDLVLGVVSLMLILWVLNRGWINALARSSAANEQLQARTTELERTTELLNRQAFQLQTTAEIAHAGSSILNPEVLLNEMVKRVQAGLDPMDVYYVGLFLLDDVQGQAVLKAATGPAGQQMLDEEYRLDVDERSAVGYCIANQKPRVMDRVQQPENPPLENTRAEIALPLQSRGRTLGALSVHSTQESAFEETDVTYLQAMADQVAVAIDNAQLFTQTGNALREVQAAHRRYLGRAWQEFTRIRPVTQVDYTQAGMASGDPELMREAQKAAVAHKRTLATESPPSKDTAETILAVPLKLREQVIGTLALHETRRLRPWTPDEISLAETVAEQVAQTIENLRLMDETQRRAARERLTGEVTARMRETLDMDTILQTAAQEIREKLELHDVTVQLQMLER